MDSIVLIDCKCLLSYPKQTLELLKKINFIKLQHLVLSDTKALKKSTTASGHANDQLEFIRQCSQILTAKLQTNRILKTLDLSLLKTADSDSMEFVQSLPDTLEYLGALPGSFHFPPHEMAYTSEPVFTELSQRLSSCQRLTTLHICLSPDQIQRLVPFLPSTLAELRNLHIPDDATATCLIDNNFPDLKCCQYSFGDVTTEKVKQLLENVPLATMHKLFFFGLDRFPGALHHLFTQLQINTNLREIHLSGFDFGVKNGSLPKLINSLNSNQLETLLIFGEPAAENDQAIDKKTIMLLLKEKLPFWPKIKQLIIFDHQTFFRGPIDLDSLQNKKPCTIL